MILFMIKKTFFDLWDHLFSVVLINLGATLLVVGALFLVQLLSVHPIGLVLGVAMGVVLLLCYIGAIALFANDIANFTTPEGKRLFHHLKTMWRPALLLSGFVGIQALLLLVVVPWYLSRGGLLGFAAIGMLFWVCVFWWLACQYYFPIRTQLGSEVRKLPSKCLMVMFDNTLFTCFLALGTVVLALLSGLTAFLFPGIGAILVWHQVGFKLRFYKYDYLNAHPEAVKSKIPWDVLLHEERERVGHRSIRGMIFPWKD